MLKVAIAGCGKIADAHAAQIRRIAGCEIVAACDREPLMAKQLCDRFGIRRSFTEISEMLAVSQPDVVHIVTPPESHFAIARICLDSGSHVYVEKPFTIDAREAQILLDLASRSGVKLTVGHNYQFSHVSRRLRTLVREGYLGGSPVHMESYYGYDLSDPAYARALLSDKRHWVRRLPGQLLQNIISHGVARIAEFLETDEPRVIAHGFVSPSLARLGESELIDELRVIISDDRQTTAYFTFSSQMRPSLHEFRIYGPKNGLLLDQTRETVIRLRGARFKSYAEHFITPVLFAREHLANLRHNVRLFIKNDFHMDHGMKYLIEHFYGSITHGSPLPISYREILLTARIMDTVFDQLRPGNHTHTTMAGHRETA